MNADSTRTAGIAPPEVDPAVYTQMHDWLRDLFPICRSITGPGVRESQMDECYE